MIKPAIAAAVFADTSGYGEAGLKDIAAALKAKNLAAVQVTRFAVGVKDLSEELKAARAAGANSISKSSVKFVGFASRTFVLSSLRLRVHE